MSDTPQDQDAKDSNEEAFDPTRRKLCPDGSCVGVIGDDGLCRECGRTEAQAEAGEARAGDAPGGDTIDATFEGAAPSGEGGEGGFDSKRRLCDDGSCVGVIGEDGACRVCGRRPE